MAQRHGLGDVDLFHGGIAECHISGNPCNSQYSEALQGADRLAGKCQRFQYDPARSDTRLIYKAWYRVLNSGTQFEKHLRWLRSFQYASPQEIYEFQLLALRSLFHHCHCNVPFYRKSWNASRFRPNGFRELETLDDVPVTSRADLRANFPGRICAHNITVLRRIRKFTSGSTGEPLEFFNDRGTLGVRLASRFLHNEWIGLRPTDRMVRMTHHQAPYRSMVNELQISTLAATRSTASRVIRYIKQARVPGIVAFPSVLKILGECLLSSPRNSVPSLKAIVSAGETLLPSDRRRLSNAFGAKVYERYSAQEVPGEFGQQCQANAGMHWNPGIVFLEVQRNGRAAKIGETGRILLTDLWNRVMPLVRYDIGDEVEIGGGCKCGRTWETIIGPIGRLQDRLTTKNGELMALTDLANEIAERFEQEISRFQLVETGKSTYKIRIVLDPRVNNFDVLKLRDFLHSYFRDIEVETRDPMRLPSGKSPLLVRI